MKNIKRLFIFIIVCLLSLVLVSCKKKEVDPEAEWLTKTVSSIEMDQASIDYVYEYDEFDVSMLKINVTYTDGTSRLVSASSDMFDDTAMEKMSTTGNPRVSIYYTDPNPNGTGEIFTQTFIVHLTDSSLLDLDLNKNGEYDAVVKAIRNRETNKIEFIVDPNSPVSSFQFEYTYDQSIMQISNFKKNDSLSGLFEYTIEDGKLTVTIVTMEIISTETVLFSLDFTGNFRTSKLAINPDFDNVLYLFNENKEVVELKHVLYHASIK